MSHAATLMLIVIVPMFAVVGWWRATRGLVEGGTGHALVTGIWTVLQFSGGLAALGWSGLLSVPAALLSQTALTIAVWTISIVRDRRGTDDAEPPSEPHDSESEPQSDVLRFVLIGLLTLGGVTAALLLVRTVWYATLLPIDSADGSTYHLPILIDALRTGQFGRPASVWTMGWTSPKAADMAFLWLLLGGNLNLVLFGQILFLPIAVISTAALAVWAGVQSRVAWVFGATILFVPVVIAQATTAYVDVAAGSLFLAAIAATLLYRAGKLRGTFGILTVFAAVGLAAGSKYPFVLPGAILLLVAFWPDLRRRQITWTYGFGVLVLLVGAHWYLAPLIWYGNPAWPYSMPILSGLFPNYLETVDVVVQRELDVAPALAKLPWFIRPLLVWVEAGPIDGTYTADSRQSGLGPLWFIIWIPAILAFCLIWVKEKRYRDLLLIGGLFSVSFLLQTYTWWTRFTWWIVGVGIVALAIVYERMSPKIRVAIAGLVVAGGLYVLLFTAVQSAWTASVVDGLMAGDDPAAVIAGEVVAYAHSQEDEIVAVPGLAWGAWNTLLLGHDFSNTLVVVGPGEGLGDRLRASGATLLFDPGWPVAWPEESLASLEPCLEEVSRDDAAGKSIYRIICS